MRRTASSTLNFVLIAVSSLDGSETFYEGKTQTRCLVYSYSMYSTAYMNCRKAEQQLISRCGVDFCLLVYENTKYELKHEMYVRFSPFYL